MMTVLRNEGRCDTSNADFDSARVTAYDERTPTAAMRRAGSTTGSVRSTPV
jgi:hypothetical protein